MEASGQLHAMAVLSPTEELPLPLEYEISWAPKPVWRME